MRWAMAGLALASVVACAVESPVAPVAPSVAGSYGLWTLNGRPMPQLLGGDGVGSVDLLSNVIQLDADATYLDILTLRRRGSHGIEIEVDTVSGGYLHFDRTLMLQPTDGSGASFYDIPDTKTLAASSPGFSVVYRRD